MAKRYVIKGPKGDYRYFAKKKADSITAFINDRPGTLILEDWDFYVKLGFKVVVVDIRELGEA